MKYSGWDAVNQMRFLQWGGEEADRNSPRWVTASLSGTDYCDGQAAWWWPSS